MHIVRNAGFQQGPPGQLAAAFVITAATGAGLWLIME
jgi:hypothetical protein